MEAVASERYRRLGRSLDAVIRAPALRPKASTPARKALPRLPERDAKRLRRAAKAARRTRGRTAGDSALAFGAGRLHAREEVRAEVAERAFEEAWEQLPHRHVDRWVRASSS